jgi:hypothetical protein
LKAAEEEEEEEEEQAENRKEERKSRREITSEDNESFRAKQFGIVGFFNKSALPSFGEKDRASQVERSRGRRRRIA